MNIDAFKPVRDLERAICEYTGAPFAVAINSCSMALLLAVAWHMHQNFDLLTMPVRWDERPQIEIPQRTYVSVPMSIIHAGGRPTFRDEEWLGLYQLKPLPVWDSARWFTSGMYKRQIVRQGDFLIGGAPMTGQMVCCSFHVAKTLADTQGGAILLDDPEADAWLRRARFDGRTEHVAPKDNTITHLGWHAYMSPDVATRLLWRLARLPAHNEPLPNDDYPDLSVMEIFK